MAIWDNYCGYARDNGRPYRACDTPLDIMIAKFERHGIPLKINIEIHLDNPIPQVYNEV